MKTSTALGRGVTKRCAVCAGRRLFTGWFRMMGWMLRRMIPRKWRGYAQALKAALEA